ncbi:hypothetical protein BS47DRAFT_1372374 [Hydnum rufescens UP504]|uniref:Mitochondrial distribution and morphology protein 10 n=1 Tax=Hydnum rufescens UP504 TaxID=1448309 RepID=A0A9P6AY62_9AGAM|nr:hypothetical protein BS47DRAFT_1372374 [Hydnum rufescens UP504]
MHPYASIILQKYYKATGWNEDNLYSNLTRSSAAILDFPVPRGVHFHISKSPNPLFKTTYSMNALPSLNGSVGYIFTSCDLNLRSSSDVRLKDVVERFKVYDLPRKPEGKSEEWLGGERVDTRDYLLYGRYYIPTSRLDAFYARPLKGNSGLGGANNVMINLQHDTGRWSTEYTWSADDGMLGARVLHNFGRLAGEEDVRERVVGRGEKRVDEEDAMEGGLRGRFSAGAEVYFSAKEKSAGGSVDGFEIYDPSRCYSPSSQLSSSPTIPTQPPTTLTAIFNPMMGHLSTAYAARVSRDLSLCSRFDFNLYSYESEWTMGAEWWIRRAGRRSLNHTGNRASSAVAVSSPALPQIDAFDDASDASTDGVQGVVKARMSTNTDVSLMWEGRIGKTLVSLGVVSDFSNRSKPIRAIGLELAYFSSE